MLRSHPRELGFGFLHGLASSAGQTYVIPLYLPGIKQSFAIGDTAVASLYAIAKISSGAVLWGSIAVMLTATVMDLFAAHRAPHSSAAVSPGTSNSLSQFFQSAASFMPAGMKCRKSRLQLVRVPGSGNGSR